MFRIYFEGRHKRLGSTDASTGFDYARVTISLRVSEVA